MNGYLYQINRYDFIFDIQNLTKKEIIIRLLFFKLFILSITMIHNPQNPDKNQNPENQDKDNISPDSKQLITGNLKKTPGALIDGLGMTEKSWIINDAIKSIDITDIESIKNYFAKRWKKTKQYPLDQMLGPILSRFGCKTVGALHMHCESLLQDQSELPTEISTYLALLQQQENEITKIFQS